MFRMGLDSDAARHLLLLAILCGLQFFFFSLNRPFFNKGEPREAVVVQSIVNDGRWLFPLRPEGRVPSKPPLFHWFGAAASLLYGEVTEATVRFPSAAFATLGVFIIYVLGRRMFSPESGLWGAVILTCSLDYLSLGVSARVDMTLCFFLTLSLFIFYSLQSGDLSGPFWRSSFYIILGASVLAKGPVSLILVSLVVVLSFAVDKQWNSLANFFFNRNFIVTVVIAGSWYALAMIAGGESFFQRQVIHENLARFLSYGEDGAGHQKPFYYYLPYLFVNGLPWTLFLPFVVVDIFRRRVFAEAGHRFLMIWAMVVFVFFSLAAGKRPDYLLPLYPPVALLTANWLSAYGNLERKRDIGSRLLSISFISFSLAAVGLLIVSAVQQEPSLFSLFGSRLKAGDQQVLMWVQIAFEEHRNILAIFFALMALLGVLLARALSDWRLQSLRWPLVALVVLTWTVANTVFVKAIATGKSYAPFVMELKLLDGGTKLYLYGDDFDTNQLFFYSGRLIPMLNGSSQELLQKLHSSENLVILSEKKWMQIALLDRTLSPPVLRSHGLGPDGDDRLVLLRGSS